MRLVGALLATILLVGCHEGVNPTVPDGASDVRVATPSRGDLLSPVSARPAQGPVSAGPRLLRASVVASSGSVVYDAVPDPLPGSYPSVGFQATGTAEWGDDVLLTAGGTLRSVTVGMSSWACENDDTRAPDEACVTTAGATFSHPVTVNLYAVDRSGSAPAVGALLATRTETFAIPFRPSWDSACYPPAFDYPFGGQWYDPVLGACVSGLALTLTFDFSGSAVQLPDEVIFGIAFDTETYGASPVGVPGPYNALNVGVANYGTSPPPSVGSDAESDYTFWNTALGNWYCDGGTGGVGVFRRDGCWDGITPVVRIEVGGDDEGPLTRDVTVSPEAVQVGTSVDVSAIADDAGTGGSAIAGAEVQLVAGPDFVLDDGAWMDATAADGAFDAVSEAVEATITPSAPGTYQLCVRSTDGGGNTGEPACVPLAAFDPAAGFMTGHGWIESDAGGPAARMRFGFEARYKKNANAPKGSAELVARARGLTFESTELSWMVVDADAGVLAGLGTVNGEPGYRFTLWAGDGDGAGGRDTFRMRIETLSDGAVVFDTEAPEPIAAGAIQVHD